MLNNNNDVLFNLNNSWFNFNFYFFDVTEQSFGIDRTV